MSHAEYRDERSALSCEEELKKAEGRLLSLQSANAALMERLESGRSEMDKLRARLSVMECDLIVAEKEAKRWAGIAEGLKRDREGQAQREQALLRAKLILLAPGEEAGAVPVSAIDIIELARFILDVS